MKSIHCPRCESRATSPAVFCTECGLRLEGTSDQVGRSKSRRLMPFLVPVAVVLLGGIAVALGYTRQSPHAPATGTLAGQAAALPDSLHSLPDDHPPLPDSHPSIDVPRELLESIRRKETTVEANPSNLAALKQLAFLRYRAGRIDPKYLSRSESSYRLVLETSPDDLDALRGLGNIAYDLEQGDKAVDFYSRYLAIVPNDPGVRTDMGTMQLGAGRVTEAIDTYQVALEANPDLFEAHFNLGVAYRSAGRNEMALAALKRAGEVATDEATRKRTIDLIATLAVDTDAADSGSFRGAIEWVFRTHPIAGSRIEAFEWLSDHDVRIHLREFPMGGMPPVARDKFVSRLRAGVRASKEQFATEEDLRFDLVDVASGEVMARVVE